MEYFKKRIRGVTTYGAQDEPGETSFREALSFITNKKINVSPLLSHKYPIEKIKLEICLMFNRVNKEYKIIKYISIFIEYDSNFIRYPFLLELPMIHSIEKKKKYRKRRKIMMIIYGFK